MKLLTKSEKETLILTLQDEMKRSKNARYDHRLHAILLIAQGLSSRRTAQLLGDSPRIISYWVRRFNKRGFKGLEEGCHSGRPSRLNNVQLEEISNALKKSPVVYNYSKSSWDGETLRKFILDRWNIKLGIRQCQRIVKISKNQSPTD